MTDEELAELLHTEFCNSSHDEYSPWCKFQDENRWRDKWTVGDFHIKYLKKARTIKNAMLGESS